MKAEHQTIETKRGIGAFKTRGEAEQALSHLHDVGIDLKCVTIIAPNSDTKAFDTHIEMESHGNKADDGAVAGAATGATLGTITGLLVGLGALAIPGIGPILLAGAEATALATTLAGTAIGTATGGIIGALIGLGIPEDQAEVYNKHLENGHYIFMIVAPEAVVEEAEPVLKRYDIEDWAIYNVPDIKLMIEDQVPLSASAVGQPQTREPKLTGTPVATTTSSQPPVVVIDRRNETSTIS